MSPGSNISDKMSEYQHKSTSKLNPSNDKKLQESSSACHQTNKLPLNLFLTPAEYSKMLITNGKHREKQTSHISEGYLSNLEFVNDHVFEKLSEERALIRMSVKNEPKTEKKSIDQCTCCCCQEFCHECEKQGHHCNKFSSIEMKKAISEIDQEIAMRRERSKLSLNASAKKLRNSHNENMNHSRRVNSAISSKTSYKNYLVKKDPEAIIHTKNLREQHTPDISHLIIKSLIEFEENKKKEAFKKKEQVNMEKEKEEHLKEMNEKIRETNLKLSKSSRSVNKTKSASKAEVSRNYWNKIKAEIITNLKNDTYSTTLKNELKNYKINVYDHKEIPKREVKLSKEEIKKLREKHEEEAKKLIEKKEKEESTKKQKIKDNLMLLEKERQENIRNTPHKPFKPSEEMINSAFKNIVEQKNIEEENNYVLTSKSGKETIKKIGKRRI